MKYLKNISLFTALIAFVFAFTFSTSYAQVKEQNQPEAYTVKGKVVNAETTEIITNVEVKVAGKDISAMTDEEGKYTLQNLPAGTYTLQVEAEGYEAWEKEVTVDQDKQVDIKLVPNPME